MKLKRITFYEIKFRYRGDNKTPQDMLRYDAAFINPDLPNIVAFAVFATKHGNTSDRPTHGRWESFSCKLTPVENERQHELRASFESTKWTTYRRSTSGFELVPYSFDLYLSVKEYADLDKKGKL